MAGIILGSQLDRMQMPWLMAVLVHVDITCSREGIEPVGTLTGSRAVDLLSGRYALRWELVLA